MFKIQVFMLKKGGIEEKLAVDVEIRDFHHADGVVRALVHSGYEVIISEVQDVLSGDPQVLDDIALLKRLRRAVECEQSNGIVSAYANQGLRQPNPF